MHILPAYDRRSGVTLCAVRRVAQLWIICLLYLLDTLLGLRKESTELLMSCFVTAEALLHGLNYPLI